MRWRFCVISCILSAVICAAASALAVVNPVEGVWANRQMLVLNLSEGEEAYYSINGADPAASGFAYDGPVLLDVVGPVELRVTSVSEDGQKQAADVSYKVIAAGAPAEAAAQSFVAAAGTVKEYTAGSTLDIPPSLSYYFGSPSGAAFLPGTTVSLPADSVVARYVPCTVTDGVSQWRFVVHVNPQFTGTVSRRTMPFTVSDWSSVSFTDRRYMYRIDDGLWSRPGEPVSLDRNSAHIIYWQSIAYEKGNPVQSFALPPRPPVAVTVGPHGEFTVTAGADGYRLGILSGSSDDAPEQFDTVRMDAFEGEETSGVLRVGVYYDSVYQGTQDVRYEIDRRPPAPPVIVSTAPSSFSRDKVTVTITGPADTMIAVADSAPHTVAPGTDYDEKTLLSFSAPAAEAYMAVPNNSAVVTFTPAADSVCARYVSAYAVDKFGNKSVPADYGVIIDTCNYFLTASGDGKNADGSRMHPYTDFATCIHSAQKSRQSYVQVSGSCTVTDAQVVLLSDCVIDGTDDARISFEGTSSVIVRSAGLTVKNCIISLESPAAEIASFIKLEHSVLTLSGSEVSAVCGRNGILIDSDSSVINMENSGLTVHADSYASCLASADTDITIKNSRIASSADTAVGLSLQGGTCVLSDSACTVTGKLGRIAELFSVRAAVTGNTFTCGAARSPSDVPVYADSRTVFTENSGNTTAQDN